MDKAKVAAGLKKYTMTIALVVVIIFFAWKTGGSILLPQNINNLFSQNAYVFVLAVGMLLCILTGGNIDLAVGSVVCFAGAVGGKLMDAHMNVYLAVVFMVLVGTLIGVWQGFWIAYIKVPPFIATLAGMYAFRGLSNVVLDGMVITLDDPAFINVFGGGADCYVKDFLRGATAIVDANQTGVMNLTCMVAGIIAVVIFLCSVVMGRMNSKKRGYETTPIVTEAIKDIIISAVVLWVAYKLAWYKGIPTSLIWILLVVLVYGYVTTKTRIGRYLYAVGGNVKAAGLSGINTKYVYFFASQQ